MIKSKNGRVSMNGNNIELTDDVMCIIATICENNDLFTMRLMLEHILKLNFNELKELLNNFKEL